MCGRFTLTSTISAIKKTFDIHNNLSLTPKFNIAPTQYIVVIRTWGELDLMHWGLKPQWLNKSKAILKNKDGFINARAETVFEKPAFRHAVQKNRCLILADGYYEWKKIGNQKQPVYIKQKSGNVFAFAGIWDKYIGEEGVPYEGAALLTCEASPELKQVHERMPVILQSDDAMSWIKQKQNVTDMENYQQSSQNLPLQYFPVSTRVNSPKFDNKVCIEPLHE